MKYRYDVPVISVRRSLKESIPQGLKPSSRTGRDAKAKALAYLEATAQLIR